MTRREHLLRALHGEAVEHFPFAAYTWLYDAALPPGMRSFPGVGRIAAASPYRVERESVQVETVPLPDGGDLTTYHTPLGDLTQRRAREPGYGSPWVMEHFVKQPEDWRRVQYVLEDTHYLPDPQAFADAEAHLGEEGVVLAAAERMPFQRLWIEFGDLEQLCVLLADDRDCLDRLVSLVTRKAGESWAMIAACGAEFVWAPDNLTSDILSPELFRRYAQPYYEALAGALRPAGQKIVAHMDGHLAALTELIAETPVEVVESFTPPPNGNLSLGQAWRAWPDKVLWVNFPPAWHLGTPERIQEQVLDLAGEVPQRRRLAFEVSEDVPPDLVAANLTALSEALASG